MRARLGGGETLDLAPSMHWPQPVVSPHLGESRTQVMTTVAYRVAAANHTRFARAMQELRRARRRSGATEWGLMQDAADPDRFVEYFFDASWIDHLRHHRRVSADDEALQRRIHELLEPGTEADSYNFV